MTKKPFSLAPIVLLLIALSSCRTRIGDFTVLSSQNVNFAQIDAAKAASAQEVEGRDIKFSGVPSLEEALDDALRKGKGNVLIDAAMYEYHGFFRHGFIVKGKVINAR